MRLFFTTCLCLFTAVLFAQNNVGIKSDGSLPDSAAKLDVQSTTQGVLLPRMTTAQRNAMPKKAIGLLVYDIDKQTLYMYNGTQWTPLAAVTNAELQGTATEAQPASSYMSYGCSVSISGDWAAVGAYGYSLPGKTGCGAVFLYKRIDGIWQQQQIITAADAAASDRFGYSVCIKDTQLIVGAYLAANGTKTYAGAAYVFNYNGNAWTQFIKLQPGDAADSDYFGYSVAIDGDRVAVGAPGFNGSSTDIGCVYIYRLETFAPYWIFDIKKIGTLPAANDRLGHSVAVSNAFVAAGVPGYNGNAGLVYTFSRSNSYANANGVNPFAPAGSNFGYSIAITNNTLTVGSPYETVNSLTNRGRVYSYYYNGTWQYNGDILLPSLQAGDQFGNSVSYANGYIIAGAPGRMVNGNTAQGESFVFKQIGTYPNTTWEYKRKITLNSGTANDRWGSRVAIGGFNVITATEWPQQSRGKASFLNIEE